MRVLIKENDPLTARTLERQLEKLGHVSEWVENARDLLENKTRLDPDVIITDIFMPDVEGLELIRMLKRGPLSNVPIIAVSGGGEYMGGIENVEDSFVAKAAVTFGAETFLRKPIALKDLEKALNACLAQAPSAPDLNN